jgi:hypothetical protein
MNRSYTNLSDIYNGPSKTTSIEYLMGSEEELPTISFNDINPSAGHDNSGRHTHDIKSVACKIRCTDILEHITTCPVCSKLYKPVDQDNYKQPTLNKHYALIGLIFGILLILILILLKIVLSKK